MQEYVSKISMLREPRVDLLKAHLEETSSPIRNIKYLCEQNNKKKQKGKKQGNYFKDFLEAIVK